MSIMDKLNVDGAREWMNNNSAAVTVGAVAVLVVSLAIIISSNSGGGGGVAPGEAYFYDVVTKKVFTDKATKIPPIESPEGNPAVRAHFFTCGECNDTEKFMGYYEKYAPEVKERLEKNPQSFELYEMAFKGRLYSNDGVKWVAAERPEGYKLTETLQHKCPPRKLRYCPPK